MQDIQVPIQYVGLKEFRTDTQHGSGQTWFGAGDIRLIAEPIASKLVLHPDIWKPVDTETHKIPARVKSAYELACRNFNKSGWRIGSVELAEKTLAEKVAEPVDEFVFGADEGEEEGDDEGSEEDGAEGDDTAADDTRYQAIRAAIMQLDIGAENKNPEFFTNKGKPKLAAVLKIMPDDSLTQAEINAVFKQIAEENGLELGRSA